MSSSRIGVVEDQQPARHAAQRGHGPGPASASGSAAGSRPSWAASAVNWSGIGRRFLGGDPVHQVIIGGVRVGVLGRPAASCRPRPCPAPTAPSPSSRCASAAASSRQLAAAAGEVRVPGRDLPHPRQRPGEPRLARHRPATRETAAARGLARPDDRRSETMRPQPGPRLRLGHPEQVHADHPGQQARPVTLAYPDHQQLALPAQRVLPPTRPATPPPRTSDSR